MSTVITWNNFPPPINTTYNVQQTDTSTFSAVVEFMDFVNTVRTEGLSMALFGKPFSQVVTDAITSMFVGIGKFVLGNGDLFFLLPAIAFAVATFAVGKNRFTKWIIPLAFAYAVSRVFYNMLSTLY